MEKLLERIEINPDIMMGKPVIKEARITVEIILKKMSQGIAIEEIINDYPKLTREDVYAALAYVSSETKIVEGDVAFYSRDRGEVHRKLYDFKGNKALIYAGKIPEDVEVLL